MNSKWIRGFTLLELLIALSISLIVFSFSTYEFKIFLNSAQSKSINQQVLNALYYARNEALAKHRRIVLCGSNDLKTCSKEWKNNLIVLDQNKVLFQFNIDSPEKLQSRFFPAGKNYLEFLSNGWLNSENGTFWYCFSGRTHPEWAIVLNKAGRARLVNPNKEVEIKDDTGKNILCG